MDRYQYCLYNIGHFYKIHMVFLYYYVPISSAIIWVRFNISVRMPQTSAGESLHWMPLAWVWDIPVFTCLGC